MLTKENAPAARAIIEGAEKDHQSITADWQTTRLLIEGVQIVEIRAVPKRGGALTEIFRSDWFPDAGVAGQVFQVALASGQVSAWHAHTVATDRLFVALGTITLTLYDPRPESPTNGIVNELHLAMARPQLVVVPPGVWHGLIVTGPEMALILNVPDIAYCYEDPDHWRLPPDTPKIPYRFRRTAASG
jgi:dTDP-4-dehydrorhamnose 3,5-epimerase